MSELPPTQLVLQNTTLEQSGYNPDWETWYHSHVTSLHGCLHIYMLVVYIPPLTTNKGHVIQTSACCLVQAIITPKMKTIIK